MSSATGNPHSTVALHYRVGARTPVPRRQGPTDPPTGSACLTVDWDQWRLDRNETSGSVNSGQLLYSLSATRLVFRALIYFISTTETYYVRFNYDSTKLTLSQSNNIPSHTRQCSPTHSPATQSHITTDGITCYTLSTVGPARERLSDSRGVRLK